MDEPIELPIDGVLDLHTFQPREIKDLVPDYLAACQERGIFQVRIIHGKGIGTLRRTVHAILAKHPQVVSFTLDHPQYGGWGATLVALRSGDRLSHGIVKLVSGGQTGADRAALDFALGHGIPHGGWCPAGRRAEDGPIAARYDLQETPDDHYEQRTEWNVRDSDGTVLFSIEPVLRGGTRLTLSLAAQYHKPVLHVCRLGGPAAPETALRRFILENRIKTLNVAGPRASEEPGVEAFVREVLEKAWMSASAGPFPPG